MFVRTSLWLTLMSVLVFTIIIIITIIILFSDKPHDPGAFEFCRPSPFAFCFLLSLLPKRQRARMNANSMEIAFP